MKDLLSKQGQLDYCQVAEHEGISKKLGRAKFRPISTADDIGKSKEEVMVLARQRAVDIVQKVVEELDGKQELDGKTFFIKPARPCDMKEQERYGDY